MNIIIDIILIAILAVSAFLAAKKGLIGTIFTLLSTLVAIVLSVILSTPVSGFIDSNFVNPSVKKYIINVVDSSSVGKSYDEALASVDVAGKIEEMPEQLKKVLDVAGIEVDEIVSKAENVKDTADETKDNLIDSIAKPISSLISRVIALALLFAVLSVGLWFAAKVITALFNLIPLGKSLNKFGGLAFGLLRGFVIVFVVCLLFSAVTKTIDPESDNLFSQKTIESTVVLKTAMKINPINSILSVK